MTGADFLAFLRHVTRAYPEGDLHVALDNVSTHKTSAVQAWLPRHRRVTVIAIDASGPTYEASGGP